MWSCRDVGGQTGGAGAEPGCLQRKAHPGSLISHLPHVLGSDSAGGFQLSGSPVDNGPRQRDRPVEPERRASRMEDTRAVEPVALYDPTLRLPTRLILPWLHWSRPRAVDLLSSQAPVKTTTILCTLTTPAICSVQTTSGKCLTGPHISTL